MKYRSQGKLQQPSHTEDWLLTYADMITLLLCFFVISLIIATAKNNASHQPSPVQTATVAPSPALEKQTESPAQLPGVFSDNRPFHKIGPADFPEVVDTEPTGDTLVPANGSPVPLDVAPPATVAMDEPKPNNPPPAVDAPLPQAPQIAATPKVPNDTVFEPKGDQIKTFEMSSAAFFASGSAIITPAGATILQDVVNDLKSDRFVGYQITVEGHTDDTPVNTAQFPSNWELSTARASAVVHFFLGHGIPAVRLRAAGYADTFPKAPNRDLSGNPIPLNQALNRRVVIKLEKIDKGLNQQ